MIEYAIGTHSNKKRKEKVNCYFSLDFTEFIYRINLSEFE